MSRYQELQPSELDEAQRRVWDDVVAGPRGSVPPPAPCLAEEPRSRRPPWTPRWRKTDSNLWSHIQRGQPFRARHSVSAAAASAASVLISESDDFERPAPRANLVIRAT